MLSLKAGGTGLNLTAANHVVHFDRWWNPAVEDQATDRAFRIGQQRNVQVHKCVCAGTLEERIDDMIDGKRALADAIVGAGEAWLTELSTDDLAKVLSWTRSPGARAGGGGRRRWCVRPAPALGSRSDSPRVMPSTANASPSRTAWSPAAAGARSGSPGGRGASSPC